ncbi:MAG: hypothetical protein M1833_004591 [Piccolia ochrophora]|nr:MAG: hypothetical protein M1833_004591 [Piccolia ochrophora]
MGSESLSSSGLGALASSDELGLLDSIDSLRSQGISHYVSLPQLIVCGDQSSGKSSVLEAISRIPFPTKDNLCTRFATEVILRRTATPGVAVSIVPSQTRSEAECQRLSNFKQIITSFTELPTLMESAKQAMNVSPTTNAFFDDVFRVEISGPDRPHLTIVDLPGLIHSENKVQSREDVDIVKKMVQSYMCNRRSIILAVVSAKNDYANQIVLKLAKEVDANGYRTMGIITKPDTLPVGSESEGLFVNLASNKDVEFRLGWHVLKNRDYEARNSSSEERDSAERQFFEEGVWKDFPRFRVGVATLRERLSKVLLDQIKAELPHLVDEIESNLRSCQSKLARLGESRAGIDEQRLFLLRISQSFQSLVKAAVDGLYADAFFGDPVTAEGCSKRLRAVVQNLNKGFADDLRLKGHYYEIITALTSSTTKPFDTSRPGDTPIKISRDDYIKSVKEIVVATRGR